MLTGLIFEPAQYQAFERIDWQGRIQNLLQQCRVTSMQRPGVAVQLQQSAVGIFAQQLREQWEFIARHAPIDKTPGQTLKLQPSDTQPTVQRLGAL